MAKRRKQYRGTPEQHRREAAQELLHVKQAVRAMHDYTRAGKCPAALDFLIVAENAWGAWEANRRHAPKGGKARPQKSYAPVARDLIRAKLALKAACFR